MENFVSSYIFSHKQRKFKRKSLSYNDIITQSFNFTYAGLIDVFIIFQRNKYILCCSGFTFDGVNVFFSKNRSWRREYETLYGAILGFHQIVNLFTFDFSMDWFNKEYFESSEFYNYADEELFN